MACKRDADGHLNRERSSDFTPARGAPRRELLARGLRPGEARKLALSKRSASKGHVHLLIGILFPAMTAWFYILRLKSGILYPGATTNLTQRWADHKAGRACRTTKLNAPVALVHYEEFESFSEARRREAQVKRWSGKKKEALAAGNKDLLCKLAASHDHQFPPAIKA